MSKPSEKIKLLIIERKIAKEKGVYDEYDINFGHESTTTKAIIQYLDNIIKYEKKD